MLRRVVVEYTLKNASDKSSVQSFVDTCMHLGDYTDDNGWCKDDTHHYYATAKNGYHDLTSNQRNYFKYDSDFALAKARYEKWAYYYGDIAPYDGGTISSSRVINTDTFSPSSGSLIIVISSISLISLLGLFLIKKKHN